MTPEPISTEVVWEVQLLHEESNTWTDYYSHIDKFETNEVKGNLEKQFTKSHFRLVRIEKLTFVEET